MPIFLKNNWCLLCLLLLFLYLHILFCHVRHYHVIYQGSSHNKLVTELKGNGCKYGKMFFKGRKVRQHENISLWQQRVKDVSLHQGLYKTMLVTKLTAMTKESRTNQNHLFWDVTNPNYCETRTIHSFSSGQAKNWSKPSSHPIPLSLDLFLQIPSLSQAKTEEKDHPMPLFSIFSSTKTCQ